MNTEKKPVLCTTLYRKPMQPCNFDVILYQLCHWIVSHGFHQKIRFERNFKKEIKKWFSSKVQFLAVRWCLKKDTFTFTFKAGPPPPPSLEAILVIFGRRALIFFVWKLLEKNEKWHHFCAHAQCWSPWRRKNVEKGHFAPSNLTFLLMDRIHLRGKNGGRVPPVV